MLNSESSFLSTPFCRNVTNHRIRFSLHRSWKGPGRWLAESWQAINVCWTNELIVEECNLIILQPPYETQNPGATCQSRITNWWQDQGSTYSPQFPIGIFSARMHFFTKPYTVLKMICRQNSTDLWKANHKLFSILISQHLRPILTWSRNSDFLLKITSGTKDYRAYFPKAHVPQLPPSDSKWDAENEAQRRAPDAGMQRAGRGLLCCAR